MPSPNLPYHCVQYIEHHLAENVASLGRVLGNRSVLYKYLNPNLLALTTINNNTLTCYLVDTVSGAVHYSAVHSGAGRGGDVFVVQSENWVVYSYWSGGENDSADVEKPDGAADEEKKGGEQQKGDGEKPKKKKKRKSKKGVVDAKMWEVVALEVFESEFADVKFEG